MGQRPDPAHKRHGKVGGRYEVWFVVYRFVVYRFVVYRSVCIQICIFGGVGSPQGCTTAFARSSIDYGIFNEAVDKIKESNAERICAHLRLSAVNSVLLMLVLNHYHHFF